MKSNANLHLPSGLGTIRTWLHIGAWLASMTPRQSKASTCSLIKVCISMLWCQGGSRLRETSHFPLSTTIRIGSTLADWCLTLIEITTMYFSQSFLGFAWNPTEPSKRIMANDFYRVSVFWVASTTYRCGHRPSFLIALAARLNLIEVWRNFVK